MLDAELAMGGVSDWQMLHTLKPLQARRRPGSGEEDPDSSGIRGQHAPSSRLGSTSAIAAAMSRATRPLPPVGSAESRRPDQTFTGPRAGNNAATSTQTLATEQ
jgi:hypothetical protein